MRNPTTVPSAAFASLQRTWGRYQHRLAVDRASLGRPHHALRHAQRAARHLDGRGDSSLELGAALDTLATCHQELGQLDAAARARRRALSVLDAVAPQGDEWVAVLVRLGDLYRFQARFDDAERVLCRAAEAAAPTQQAADAMPLRAMALNALGIVYKDTGRYDAAAAAYSEALDLVSAATGPEHPCCAVLWHNFAGLAHARGHPDEAAPLAARAVRLHERQLGPDHHVVAQDLAVLGATLLEQGRVDEAEPLFEWALTIFQRRHPADQYEVAVNLSNLAACCIARGEPAQAERLLRRGLTTKQAILGADHPEIARQLNRLSVAVARQHRTGEAADLHRQALAILDSTLRASDPLTVFCSANAVAATGAESEPTLRHIQQGEFDVERSTAT